MAKLSGSVWKNPAVVAAGIAAVAGIVLWALNHFTPTPAPASAPTTQTGNASTTGSNSPANTGNGNKFNTK
jgi:hypothetical protein